MSRKKREDKIQCKQWPATLATATHVLHGNCLDQFAGSLLTRHSSSDFDRFAAHQNKFKRHKADLHLHDLKFMTEKDLS